MERPNKVYITSARIKKVEDLSIFEINFQFNKRLGVDSSNYCLVIKLETKKFIRITCYPILKTKILKLSFKAYNLIRKDIDAFSKEIQQFNIIHSTGLVAIEKKLVFECYLNLNKDEEEYKDLITLLDKNKSKFEDIKLEEIVLENDK
jgi:hypothetical protein